MSSKNQNSFRFKIMPKTLYKPTEWKIITINDGPEEFETSARKVHISGKLKRLVAVEFIRHPFHTTFIGEKRTI